MSPGKPRGPWATAAVVGVIGALWFLWSPPGANDLRAGDEGYYGTQARNVLVDPWQLVSPSLTPLGPPGDKPPLYAAMLALSVGALGPTETAVRWPSYVLGLAVAIALAGLLRTQGDSWLPWLGAALLLSLPWYADASRSATPDIPLTLCGLAALTVLATRPIGFARVACAGLLLGLGFQFKLWLVGIFVLPAFVLVLAAPGRWARLAVMLGVAAAVGGAHLLAVALLRPDDLAHWWSIYWQRFVVERVAGAGGALVAVRPPVFYWVSIAHAWVLILPLVAMGLEESWRRRRDAVPRALLAWSASLIVLSAFAVKSGVYLYALMPLGAALAALGARALGRGQRPGVAAVLVAVASQPWLAERWGGPAPPFAVWLAAWVGCFVAVVAIAARPAWGRRVALGLAVLGVAGGLAREAQRMPPLYHRPGYREIAAALSDSLAGIPPQRRSFIGPEAPTFAFHWFRTGDYWGTPIRPWSADRFAEVSADTALRVFIVDPEAELYGGWPDSATVAWLEGAMREVSDEIGKASARPIRLRVFVRERGEPAGATPAGSASPAAP
jgi:4-amino-4-deoxy-L-arabinose transferase-like glycosyltransferase